MTDFGCYSQRFLFVVFLSVRLSVFLLFLEKKLTRSIRNSSYCFTRVDDVIGRAIEGFWEARRRVDNASLCLFQKMDPEEHCLKLITGGKTFRRLVISWHATVKGWPEESRNPQHVYQELPADIFMFHTHYDLFSVPSFLLCLCWTLHDFKCHWQTNFKVVASYPRAKRFDRILQRFRRQANVATRFNT